MQTLGVSTSTGTTISFMPDAEIFEEIEWSTETLLQRLRETAFLTRGLRITLTDERAGGEQVEFHYEGGIRDFVAHVNEAKDPVHKHIVYFEGENEQGDVEVAMQWNTKYVESVFSFANNINTHEGGSHLSGFNAALTRTLNKYARDKSLLKEKEENLEGEDVREGSRRRHLREAAGPAVRGPDEDEARQPVGARLRRADGQRAARGVPRGEPDRREADHHEGDLRLARAARGAQGARPDAAQGRVRRRDGQEVRRLPAQGPRV